MSECSLLLSGSTDKYNKMIITIENSKYFNIPQHRFLKMVTFVTIFVLKVVIIQKSLAMQWVAI